jgi:hypothetical protein
MSAYFDVGDTCVQNEQLSDVFFNHCYRDPTSLGIAGFCGAEILTWFGAHQYFTVCIFSLFMIPFFGAWFNTSTDTTAHANSLRWSTFNLLFRVAFVYSLANYLEIALQQQQSQPCLCVDVRGVRVERVSHGMPSADSAATAMLAAFLLETVSIPLGLLVMMLFGASQIITGLYTIGQVLAGFALGLVFHVLQTRTPAYARPVEFLLNLIGGVVTLAVIKHIVPTIDVSLSVGFFGAVIIQALALVLTPVSFHARLMRELLRKSIAHTSTVDFLFYHPLRDQHINYNLTEPEPTAEKRVNRAELIATSVAVLLALVLLCGVRVASPHLNDWFAVKI